MKLSLMKIALVLTLNCIIPQAFPKLSSNDISLSNLKSNVNFEENFIILKNETLMANMSGISNKINEMLKLTKNNQIIKSHLKKISANYDQKSHQLEGIDNSISKNLNITETKSEREEKKIYNSLEEFLLSFSLNFFSEIGDKSFLSIVLFYNQISPIALFIVASLAELSMNLLSVFIGYKLRCNPKIKLFAELIGIFTAILFASMIIYEYFVSLKANKEKGNTEEIDNEIKEIIPSQNFENKSSLVITLISIVNIFCLIFFSELGDKSQITTIILSTEYNPVLIFLGTALAHILGILLSMIVGYFSANYLNKSFISLIGMVFFIYFGVQLGLDFFKSGGFSALIKV